MSEYNPPAEHTLLNTDDAMVWAEEFVRIFAGHTIMPNERLAEFEMTPIVDAGTMVAWFAGAMVTAVNLYERKKLTAKEEQQESFMEGFNEGRVTYRVDVGESITEVVDESP